ncbi:MAG: metallophosphoesterase family protein [Candidatus Poribacteria bacterium]
MLRAIVLEIWRRSLFWNLALLVVIGALIGIHIWYRFRTLPERDWNYRNLENINPPNPERFSFAVFGDNKNSHAVFEGVLQRVSNEKGIAFAIDVGDMVYDGEKEKYRYFFKQVKRNCTVPLLLAIGNHELRENGRGLYYEIVGPYYYSFSIGSAYFIVLDDADEEGLDMWQRGWLEEELEKAQSYKNLFIFLHIPLFDPRRGAYHHSLPWESGEELIRLFKRYGVTHIFASHIHAYYTGEWDGVPFTISGGAGAELMGTESDHYFYHYLRVDVDQGKVSINARKMPSPEFEWADRFAHDAFLYIYAFVVIHAIDITLFILIGVLAYIIIRKSIKAR